MFLIGNFLAGSNQQWGCCFGDVEVPAKFVTKHALKCISPPKTAGLVKVVVTSGNGIPCSNSQQFEFISEMNPPFFQAYQPSGYAEECLKTRIENLNIPSSTQLNPFEPTFQSLLSCQLQRRAKCIGEGTEIGEMTLTQLASALGFDWAIPLMLGPKFDVNHIDSNGYTALHWAVTSGK